MMLKPAQICFVKLTNISSIRRQSTINVANSTSSCSQLNWKQSQDTHKSLTSCNIVTFNMLAPCYKRTFFRSIRSRESSESDKWLIRAQRTVEFLRQEICPSATIIALQEFWLQEEYYSIFQHVFDIEGFDVRYMRRTGSKSDAVALIIRKNIFEILGSENIPLCGQNDRVALLLWLQHKSTGKHFLVVNTHLSFPHSVFDKMAQVRQMQTVTEAIDRFALRYRILRSTRIILGDFNVENQSPVCDHLRASGYSSCFDVSPPADPSHNGSNTASHEPTTAAVVSDDHISLPESYFHDAAPAQVDSLGNSSDITLDQEHTKDHPILTTHSVHGTDHHSRTETEGKINETAHAIPFDSHAAFVQSRLELLRQTRLMRSRPSFVSHFNHRQEEVGVDHIFVLPEALLTPEAIAASSSASLVSSSGSLTSGRESTATLNASQSSADGVTRTVISANASYTGAKVSGKRQHTGAAGSSTASATTATVQSAHYVPLTHGKNHYSNHQGRESPVVVADACPIPDNPENFTRPGLEDDRDDDQFATRENEFDQLLIQEDSSTAVKSIGGTTTDQIQVSRGQRNNQNITGGMNPKQDDKNIPSIFISHCQVLPASLTSKVWHPEFQISDHRPISATFVIAEKHT